MHFQTYHLGRFIPKVLHKTPSSFLLNDGWTNFEKRMDTYQPLILQISFLKKFAQLFGKFVRYADVESDLKPLV